jgi:hypothetical protein
MHRMYSAIIRHQESTFICPLEDRALQIEDIISFRLHQLSIPQSWREVGIDEVKQVGTRARDLERFGMPVSILLEGESTSSTQMSPSIAPPGVFRSLNLEILHVTSARGDSERPGKIGGRRPLTSIPRA